MGNKRKQRRLARRQAEIERVHGRRRSRTLQREWVARADADLRRRREDKNPRVAMTHLLEHGDVGGTHVPAVQVAARVRRLVHGPDRPAARAVLEALYDRSKVLDSATEATVQVVANLARWRERWIRDVADWRPRSRNRRRTRGDLLRHLLARWDVPRFMDAAWEVRSFGRAILWWLRLADGKNLRTAPILPFPLTKRMAHAFVHAPAAELGGRIGRAFTWAFCRCEGGAVLPVRAILALPQADMTAAHPANAFWLEVWRWFLRNPMLDRSHYGPIVDYLQVRKFEPVLHADGTTRPEQPGLSMRGRDPLALLRAVDRWHARLHRVRACPADTWEPSGVCAPEGPSAKAPEDLPTVADRGVWTTRTGPKHRRVEWTVVELLSGAELAAEGRKLRHCVYSYAHPCTLGRTSIWSMRRKDPWGDHRVLTIEVDRRGKRVVQARGRDNAWPDEATGRALGEWANAAGLAGLSDHATW